MSYILLFVFAGMAWAGLVLLALAVHHAIMRIRTPKPTDHELEWKKIEEDLRR